MILPKIKVLRSHGKQYIPDLDAVELTEEFRGRPHLTETPDTADLERAAAICPTGALTTAPLSLDLGRCLFCGECARTACRIKDPSLHNWLALALAVRGEGISDFPICNKSFNLSYCGHDL